MTTALPNINQTTELYGFFTYINNASDGFFFNMVLLAEFLILFLTSIYRTSAPRALSFASFITFISSLILVILGLVHQKYMYLSAVIMGISILWLTISND